MQIKLRAFQPYTRVREREGNTRDMSSRGTREEYKRERGAEDESESEGSTKGAWERGD